jgi:hypothetical protein
LKYFHILWCHKTAGTNKIIWLSAGKVHIFVTPFRYLSLLTTGQKSENMAVQGRLQGKFFGFDFNASPTIASAREYCPFQSCKQTLAS